MSVDHGSLRDTSLSINSGDRFGATVISDELVLIRQDYLANGGLRCHVPCCGCVATSSVTGKEGQRLCGGMGNSVQTSFSKVRVQGSWLTVGSVRVGRLYHNFAAKLSSSGDLHRD
jgi:hypothetical protein